MLDIWGYTVVLPFNKSKKCGFPKDEQGWIKYITSLHTNALSERQSLEATWARNIAYYFGFQHLVYDPCIKMIQIDTNRDEYIINRIAPFVDQRVAKLIRSKPTLGVLPDKTDTLTIKAAEISEKVLKNIWKINDKDAKLHDAVLLMTLMGSSFKKVIWDSEGGDAVLDEQNSDGQIEFDEETGAQKMQKIFLGDVENIVKSPFEILCSKGARSIKQCEWIMDRSCRTAIEVQAKFKEFDIDALSGYSEDLTTYEKFVYNLGCPSLGTLSYNADASNYDGEVKEYKLVMVKEFWMKPNYSYPKGVLATVVGKQLLQFEEWPYDHGMFPFVKLDHCKNSFGFYGLSPVSRLIEVQRHYNESRTQIAKNARYMSNLKWWAAKGCGLAEDALTDEEGEVVETNPNMPKPEAMQVSPLPNYVIENQNQDLVDFRDVGGEKTIDQAPFANMTAGVAIETAAELSDLALGPTIKNIEQGLTQEGRLELHLANQYYTDDRTMKIVGEGEAKVSIMRFNNEDLRHQTDISVVMETSLGNTRAAVRQSLMDMWDRRILTDPDEFKQAYACGNIDVILKSKNPATSVVLEDIEMIKEGKEPPVSQFDNHVVYIKMLSDFIQTPEFRKLAPDRQQLASMVLQAHLQYMQPQQPMPEQNQAAVGTPFGQQVTEPPASPEMAGVPEITPPAE